MTKRLSGALLSTMLLAVACESLRSGTTDALDAGSDAALAGDVACTSPSDTDPANCGRCGHSCIGGTCEGGQCQPVTVFGPTNYLAEIAIRGAHLYWVEQGTAKQSGTDGRVARIPREGCTDSGPCDQTLANATAPISLAVDDTNVYFSSNTLMAGEVRQVPVAGGTSTVFSASEPGIGKLAVDDLGLYMVRQGQGNADGTVQGRDLAQDTSSVPILSGLDLPYQVAVRGTDLFVTTRGALGSDFDGKIIHSSIHGASATIIAHGLAQPRGLTLDGTYVYWATSGNGTICRARWDGTDFKELVAGGSTPTGIVIDDDGGRLYWTERGAAPDYLDGRVRSAKLDGSDVLILAHDLASPSPIAIDDSTVFVGVRGTTDSGYRDGSIVRIAKP